MKPWIKIVLLASLAFNLAFLGLWIYHRAWHPMPEGVSFEGPDKQPPPPEGEDKRPPKEFWEKMSQFKTDMDPLRDSYHQCRRRFMDSLANPEADTARIASCLDSLVTMQNKMEHAMGENLIKIRNNEGPEFFRQMIEHKRSYFNRKNKQKDFKDTRRNQ